MKVFSISVLLIFSFGCSEKLLAPSEKRAISTYSIDSGIPKDRAHEIICKENAGPSNIKDGISLQKVNKVAMLPKPKPIIY